MVDQEVPGSEERWKSAGSATDDIDHSIHSLYNSGHPILKNASLLYLTSLFFFQKYSLKAKKYSARNQAKQRKPTDHQIWEDTTTEGSNKEWSI